MIWVNCSGLMNTTVDANINAKVLSNVFSSIAPTGPDTRKYVRGLFRVHGNKIMIFHKLNKKTLTINFFFCLFFVQVFMRVANFGFAFFWLRLINLKHIQIKSSSYSRYHVEACNEWRGPSPRHSNTAPKKRRSEGKLLTTLCTISPVRVSNHRHSAPITRYNTMQRNNILRK